MFRRLLNHNVMTKNKKIRLTFLVFNALSLLIGFIAGRFSHGL